MRTHHLVAVQAADSADPFLDLEQALSVVLRARPRVVGFGTGPLAEQVVQAVGQAGVTASVEAERNLGLVDFSTSAFEPP